MNRVLLKSPLQKADRFRLFFLQGSRILSMLYMTFLASPLFAYADGLSSTVDKIVGSVQGAAIGLAVIMLIWIVIKVVVQGGGPQALHELKGQIIVAVVCIIILFNASNIVNYVKGLSGF